MGKKRNAYKNLVGRNEGKRSVGKFLPRWKHSIKWILKKEGV
jgi:hypothetical protein